MPNSDMLDDDDDDEFFNDPEFLARIDQVETQFTSTQQLFHSQAGLQVTNSTNKAPPAKKLKTSHHPLAHPRSAQDGHQTPEQPMDYDGPDVYMGLDGNYHLCRSPSPPVQSVQPCGPSSALLANNEQRIPDQQAAPYRTSAQAVSGTVASSAGQGSALKDTSNLRPGPANRVLDSHRANSSSSHVFSRTSRLSVAEEAFQPKRDSLQDELARLQAEVERANESLKHINLEKSRLKGEVSILRSSSEMHRAKASKQISDLQQSEQQSKQRAERAERELQRIRSEKETQEIFKDLQASARRPPPSSARSKPKNIPMQTSPSPKVKPQLLFKGNLPVVGKKEPSSKFSDLQLNFESSQIPAPKESLLEFNVTPKACHGPPATSPQSHRHDMAPESLATPASGLHDHFLPLSTSQRDDDQVTQPPYPIGHDQLSHLVIVNLFQSFVARMRPPLARFDSVISLQNVLPATFSQVEHKLQFDQSIRNMFNYLSQPLSKDWNNVANGEEAVMRFVEGLGSVMISITKLLSQAHLQEALPTSISMLNTLCQTSPLFCSLFLSHPDFQSDCNIIPLILDLIALLSRPDAKDRSCEHSKLKARSLQNVLDLLETLVWDPAEVCYPIVELLLKSEETVDFLTYPQQPPQLLLQGLSLVMSLSYKPSLHESIFSVPIKNPRVPSNSLSRSTRRDDQGRASPIVERLLALLAIEDHAIQMKVLRILTVLAGRSENGLIRISESSVVISTLIRLISAASTTLWHGDGGPSHRAQIPLCVDRIELALDLIFRIIFDSGSRSSLMDRLQEASRQNPGIHHDFVISFAKLTFSELPPSGYLSKEQLNRLDIISDLAYDLLRSVASPDELHDWKICSADDSESSVGAEEGEDD